MDLLTVLIVTLFNLQFWLFAWVIFLAPNWEWRFAACLFVGLIGGLVQQYAHVEMARRLGEKPWPIEFNLLAYFVAAAIVAVISAGLHKAFRKRAD